MLTPEQKQAEDEMGKEIFKFATEGLNRQIVSKINTTYISKLMTNCAGWKLIPCCQDLAKAVLADIHYGNRDYELLKRAIDYTTEDGKKKEDYRGILVSINDCSESGNACVRDVAWSLVMAYHERYHAVAMEHAKNLARDAVYLLGFGKTIDIIKKWSNK